MQGTVVFDLETHSADRIYTMPPEEFIRICGYKWWGQDEVTLTTDIEEMRAQIRAARFIVGHNVTSYDLPALFGVHSNEPLELAMAGRVYDTMTHAVVVHPAPATYTNRYGKGAVATSPDKAKAWFSLDEQAYQLGVPGKTHDLKALAREFGGFGEIPVGDERYRDYLRGDVIASEHVARALLKLGPLDAYALREQEIEARKAVISANGFRVDIDRAQARVDELAARREVIMSDLIARYGMPSDGASPWATQAGKEAILAAFADAGITPDTVDWPHTPAWEKRSEHRATAIAKADELNTKVAGWEAELTEVDIRPRKADTRRRWIASAREEAARIRRQPLPPGFGLSFGGSELMALTKATEVEDLGQALAELKGQRSLAQLALDSVHSDGFAHPQITMMQRSGRWSTTEPGLTVWTDKGPNAVEKAYFLPDSDDEVLVEFDLSNADARMVAALSGDREYAKRFEPGQDGHLINAWAAWGKDVVGTDKHDPTTARYRDLAKPGGHGWGYLIGAKKLAATWGLPVEEAKSFLDSMNAAFPAVVGWQRRSTSNARRDGYVVSEWGRKLYVEPGREYTQPSALLGQNGTREIICDGLLKTPISVLRKVKAQIHDALVLSVPRDRFEACRDYVISLLSTEFEPARGGQRIEFPADAGPAGDNWFEAKH